ncbi:hypothetical protein AB0C38_27415 [Amycolatopsis sp. NPDC048633]|uniref:hypothetical protein n=1 Tax=Amycolatopsis sp. NPDC048633 TaxID=3157095 RepID=UPI0033FF9B21
MTEPVYPGDPGAQAEVQQSCAERMAGMFGGLGVEVPPSLVVVGYAPDEGAWAAGSRIGVCGLQSRVVKLTDPLFR